MSGPTFVVFTQISKLGQATTNVQFYEAKNLSKLMKQMITFWIEKVVLYWIYFLNEPQHERPFLKLF